MIHDGRETRTNRPIAGKTYRIVLRGDDAEIADEGGGKPADDELEILRKMFNGAKSRVASIIRAEAQPVHVGERAPGIEAILRFHFAQGVDKIELGDVRAVLTAQKTVDGSPCGVFEAHVQMATVLPPGLRFGMDLRGEIVVRVADSHLLRVNLAGPSRMSGTVNGVAVTADGRATYRRTERSD
jgi:hypothetical protein